jgi:hypothetical protein
MKVLLCLLSEQHIPNLLSVHHFKPDSLVLVETRGMKEKNAALNFLKALRLGGQAFDEDCIQPLNQANSLVNTRKALEVAFERYRNGEWIVNLTGGTKPMSIGSYEFFREKDADLIYIDNRQPNVFIHLADESTESCTYQPSIQEFLAGYGFELSKSLMKVKGGEEQAREWWECARILALHASADNLLAISDDERKKLREERVGLLPIFYRHNRDEVVETIEQTFPIELRSRGNKSMGRFLTGEWLEVFIWGLLDHHKEALGIWDVRLGLQVRKVGAISDNELDVAFMRNYALCSIECKSGAQSHDSEGEILYKIEAITRQTRALHVKSYLATTSNNIYKDDGTLKATIRDRTINYNSTLINLRDIQGLAKNWQDAETVKKILERRPDDNA